MMPDEFKYDVFLSHSANDKLVVRDLAERLKADGLQVWFDEWVIPPGDTTLGKIQEGLESSRVLVLAMSRHAFDSEWTLLESGTFLFRDPTNKNRRFIPLRLDDTELKDSLKQFAYVDWREPTTELYAALLTACRATLATARQATDATARPRPIAEHDGHAHRLVWVALTPDGERATSIGYDRTLRVWDLRSGIPSKAIKHPEGFALPMALSVPNERIVSSGEDGRLQVWDLRLQALQKSIPGPSNSIECVAITTDGRWAISGSGDHLGRWDLELGQYSEPFRGQIGTVLCVAIDPDGTQVFSGSSDGNIRVWDLHQGTPLAELRGHSDRVYSLALAPDGSRLLSGSADNTVRVWDWRTQKQLVKMEGHTGTIHALAISADGRRAVSGSNDRTVLVWDLEFGEPIAILENHRGLVWGVGIGKDGQNVVSGSDDVKLRIWNLAGVPTGSSVLQASRYTNANVPAGRRKRSRQNGLGV